MGWTDCIFDLYGTLVDIHTDEEKPELWIELADLYKRYGAIYKPEMLKQSYHRLVQEELQGKQQFRQDTHESYPEIQLETVFQSLFLEKDILTDTRLVEKVGKQFRFMSIDYIRLYDGAKELLAALRKAGKRIWLLSNAQRMFTIPELQFLQLENCFDGIYLSSDYGCKKPERQFFDVLLHEQQILPEQAVMIGNDGICDIQGAKHVGLSTIYIRSNISPKEPLPQADYVLESMDLNKVQHILLHK